MKIINLDILTEEEAKIVFKGIEYTIKEPTLKEWAEFISITQEKEENEKVNIEYMIKICSVLIPELFILKDNYKVIDDFTTTEFIQLYKIVITLFNEGIDALGKKTKPLHKIIKTV